MRKVFRKRKTQWPWRDFLTEDEALAIREADKAKSQWEEANARRAGIVNRAIQRARYAAGVKS